MRLTEFADPKTYAPTTDDAAVLDRHHQLVRPDGSTDKPGLSAQRAKPCRRSARQHSATRYKRVSKASAGDVISAAAIVAFAMVHSSGRLQSRAPPSLWPTI